MITLSDNDFVDNIIIPFFEEIKLRNQLYDLTDYESLVEKKYKSLKKNECLTLIKNNLFSNRISSYVFEKPLPSKNEIAERIKKLMLVEVLFQIKIIDSIDFKFTEEIKDIFIYLVGMQTYMSSYRLEKITEINIYIDATEKIIEYYKENKIGLNEKDKKWFIFLKRCLYLVSHETGFTVEDSFFNKCIALIKDDIEYSKNVSVKEYLFAVTNFLYIYLDHLFMSINTEIKYLKLDEFKKYYNELITYTKEILDKENNFKQYKIYSVFFLKNLYSLKVKLKKKENIDQKFKTELLIQCTELIQIFYGTSRDHDIFYDKNHQKYKKSYNDALKEFSIQLSKVLNDNNINTLDILFRIFHFLFNFIEYIKLNTNIYARIKYVSMQYYYRKISILSNVLYLKSLNDLNKFKREIVIIKNNIEYNPITSLITFYNNEIISINNLPPNLINYYKVDPNVIQIFDKIYFVNKFVFNSISDFRSNFKNDPNYKIKLEFLFNVQNEINNIITVVSDPSLIKELGQFYCHFIDNYISKEGMEYREDYLNKANIIKFSILDINPINFALTLLFSKMGKIKFIIFHRNPAKLGIKKKSLTQMEKDEIANYLEMSSENLPKSEGMFNWESIENSFKHLRDPALIQGNIAIPDSRILKVLCAILNKITRHDTELSKLFLLLISESYDYAKKIWDLDPIIIYYFCSYFAKRGKKIFFNENTGKKIEVRFSNLNNSIIAEKINLFIRDMLENVKQEDSLNLQFDEIITGNEESLIEPSGKIKNISLLDIKNIINSTKTITFEKSYITLSDKVYLTEILSFYLTSIGKSFLSTSLKYIMSELIDNANKSNLKRVYFKQKNYDFNTKYIASMSGFMETIEDFKSDYIHRISDMDLKVKISFKIFNDNIIITISNNFKISQDEIKLMDEAIHRARTCKNLKDAYKYPAMSTREGRGFGLITVLLFLRKYRLDKNCFKINILSNETKIIINIPYLKVSESEEEFIAEEISTAIETIPMIPEHVRELEKKLKDPEVKFEDIEKLILTDPSLSADIIRISNSSYYMVANPVKTVIDGIKILGIKGIESTLAVSTSYRLLENQTSKDKIMAIFSHSEQTAFYAKELAVILKIETNLDDIYIASLLHDIGKIIVEGLNPEIYEKIQFTFNDKYIPIEVIEDLAGGINHSLIGYLIAEKWKFPELVCEVIRCHHKPRDAHSYPKEVFLVYLANILTYYTAGKMQYENIDLNALEYFGINSKEKVDEICQRLKNLYQTK